jgi:formylglycine-generating enzyme required for sulfatase activity
MMGSPRDEENRSSDEDKHRVMISKDFYMGQTEVTQSQYRAIMNNEPWLGKSFIQQSNNNPAAYISWDEAKEFCKSLTQKEGRTYKLPTEAQWEYACRAGTTTRYSFGDSESSLGEYAWFYGNAGNADERFAHLVAQKKMNAFNLYDMHGNVWEWCRDWYKSNYYEDSPNIDPEGPSTGSSRVLRGGCWNNGPGSCRSSIRRGNTPNYRSGYIGFRVVMEIEK